MNWITQLLSRRRIYSDLSDEIQEHLAEKVEELVASGMSREEATYAARREFGNATLIEERGREVWQWPSLESLLTDIRYALRMLRKNPGFTSVAVLTLALGIGANTAIFSVVNAVLLQSLPYQDPDRLVWIASGDSANGFGDNISLADFQEWKARSHSFDHMAAFQGAWFTLAGDEPQRIHGDLISADWLPTLGVRPMMGRNFEPDEEAAGRDAVVILSDDCWRRRLNADPNILGKRLILNDRS
jgi:hypothetical protein